MKDYQKDKAAAATVEATMPDAVAVTLAELAGSLREGLLAMAVGAGLQVMDALVDESVTALAGPKFEHDPERAAVRHGTEAGLVLLGAGGSRSAARGCAAPTGRRRWRCPPMTCSARPTCWARWRSSG